MDRVGKLASQIVAFLENLSKAMSDLERKEAELCWRYRVEDDDLNNLVERRTWLEERKAVLNDRIAKLTAT